MGMTIDADRFKELLSESRERLADNISDKVISIIKENYIHKADYENRLKADLVAMLTEIQLEIEEEAFDMTGLVYIPNTDNANVVLMDDLNKIFEQKINSLKEASGEVS